MFMGAGLEENLKSAHSAVLDTDRGQLHPCSVCAQLAKKRWMKKIQNMQNGLAHQNGFGPVFLFAERQPTGTA
jgi:predicted PP-loop superfamily ATPase